MVASGFEQRRPSDKDTRNNPTKRQPNKVAILEWVPFFMRQTHTESVGDKL